RRSSDLESYRAALANTGTTMVLSPDSAFFRYFGSSGELPAASTTFATPITPREMPGTAAPSTGPALDGLGIEETIAPPAITLEDGSELTPTIGTEAPAPVEAPAPATGQ